MVTVLAVGAHPDDAELGCGGTLALHKRNGDKVYLLVLSRGEASGDPKVREKECRKSAEMLGVDGLFFGDLEDTRISDGLETILAIEQVIDKVKPGIIYTHSYKDTHQDHRNASYATLSAGRNINKILMYESPSSLRDFVPQVFTDISATFELKRQVTNLFASHSTNSRYMLAADVIESLARYRGFQARVTMAEAFEVGKFIHDVLDIH